MGFVVLQFFITLQNCFAEVGIVRVQGLREAGAWTQVEHIWAEVSDDRSLAHPCMRHPT